MAVNKCGWVTYNTFQHTFQPVCQQQADYAVHSLHSANVARSCFYQLRQLRSIWQSLTTDAWRTLITAFVAGRVDYCDAVLHGTSTAFTRRLQMLLNATARLVVGIGKYEHITPVLRDTLHWLPVAARIQFKIAALTFDCVRGAGPDYFKQVIRPVSEVSCRSLHSASRGAGKYVHWPTKFFLSRLLSSGTHFYPTYAHRPSIANSSDPSWKLICSDKPTTLHDSSENNLLKGETL